MGNLDTYTTSGTTSELGNLDSKATTTKSHLVSVELRIIRKFRTFMGLKQLVEQWKLESEPGFMELWQME